MIQSPPLLSQVGGRTRFFMEQEQANCDPSHGPARLTFSSQSFMPGFSSERGNYIESGGTSSYRAGLDFYNTRAKAEMISVGWESPIMSSAEFPSGCQGSPARNWLSMGNGLGKTADHELKAGNSEECTQNSPASFQPELSVHLSMRSRSSDEESEPTTGSQQIAQSAINGIPKPYNFSPLNDGDQGRPRSPHSMGQQDDHVRTHNFPTSCADSTEIDRPSEINNPVLSSTEFPVQRGAAREPWINRLYRLQEAHDRVHDQKLWAPLKKMARKNNMTAITTCKNSMEAANNSGHIVGSRNSAAARTCVDCYTTKTPLWRTGPRGPKSLCNACGIRYRKTRRAALSERIDGNAAGSPKRKTEENSIHFKKRSRLSMASCKKNIGLENHSAFQRVFAQDEEEAAVLLMALSCGLVHG